MLDKHQLRWYNMGMPNIKLSTQISGGFASSIENSEGFGDCDIYISKHKSAKQVCLITAARLRDLAYKFEMLAEDENPCNSETQSIVSEIRLTNAEKQKHIFRKIQNEA